MFTCVILGSFICNSFYNLLKWKLKYCFCGVNLKSSGTRTVEQMQSRTKIYEGLLPVTCSQCFHLGRIAEASTPFRDQAAADLQFPTQSQFAHGCWRDLWPCGSTGACSDTWVSWGANASPWPLQPGRALWARPCTLYLQICYLQGNVKWSFKMFLKLSDLPLDFGAALLSCWMSCLANKRLLVLSEAVASIQEDVTGMLISCVHLFHLRGWSKSVL